MAPTPNASPRGRFQSPEIRRRQILDAAAHLAVAEGLASTSIASVAETAGLAKGSIYLHFESRHALLAGLQADVWEQMLAHPQELVADANLDWPDRLDAIVAHWMNFEFDHQGLYHAVFHTVATDSDEPLTEARSLLTRLIEEGVAAGQLHLDGLDADVVIEFLLHGYVGPCFHHTDKDDAIATVQRLFRRVVGVSATT